MSETLNISNNRIIYIFLFCSLFFSSALLSAQADKKFIRKGNREYEKNNFSQSEILYRKASDKNNQSPEAVFNIGDALYKQDKFEEAGKQFIDNMNRSEDRYKKAAGLYNLGNSLLMAKKLEESIAAYKNSLKLNPENLDAKYNLGYAQNLLQQQQQQQQQQNQNNDQNKENQNQDQKEQEENNDDKQQQQQPKDQQQKGQEQQQGISKEDAERLLNAIANDEKEVQEKVKREQAARTKVRTIKNW